MGNTNIDNAVKIIVLKKKLEIYRNTYYDVSLDLEIAEELGQDRMVEKRLERLREVKKAILLLEGKLQELEKEVDDEVS